MAAWFVVMLKRLHIRQFLFHASTASRSASLRATFARSAAARTAEPYIRSRDLVLMPERMRPVAQDRQAATDCEGWRAEHNEGDGPGADGGPQELINGLSLRART